MKKTQPEKSESVIADDKDKITILLAEYGSHAEWRLRSMIGQLEPWDVFGILAVKNGIGA